MMLIFALGAVFGAMLGAFTLALIMACTDYNDAQRQRRRSGTENGKGDHDDPLLRPGR